MKDVQSLLQKLDTALGKKKPGGNGKIDFKELAELRKKSFLKLKEGKNNIVLISPKGAEDPFVFWGYHNNLQEVAYYSVPCDGFNKNGECVVCNVVEDLKKSDFDGNKHLWYPIRQQIEYYAPTIVVDSEATINEGPRWLRLSKTVMTQLTEWIRNLEKDEKEFYSDDEPQKIIVNYDKGAAPMEQYKLDKKNYKQFNAQLLESWRDNIRPIGDFILSKSSAETTKIVDAYFERVTAEVSETDEDETTPKKK